MEVGIILIHYLIHEVQYHVVNMGGNRNNQRDNLVYHLFNIWTI